MDLGQSVIIGLSIFLGLWFVVGSTINRKRGIATFRWLRDGIESLGKVSEARWIGSSGSGARLTVSTANRPFQRIEIVFLLDSRELMPLWLFNMIRGKKDEMILKANLRSLPSGKIEVARSGSKDSKELSNGKGSSAYTNLFSTAGFEILGQGKPNEAQIASLQAFIEKYPVAIKRISLQQQMPHLILRADLPPIREANLDEFFNDLKAWASA